MTPGSHPSSTPSTSHPLSPTRRAARRIVVASFNNESDALSILAHAATDEDNKGSNLNEAKKDARDELEDFALIKRGVLDEVELESLVRAFFEHYHPALVRLFSPLCRLPEWLTLNRICSPFSQPIFQSSLIPTTRNALAALAHSDPFLLTSIITVSSQHHPNLSLRGIHDKSWALLRQTLADHSFAGLGASVGLVEGVLLLAEFLPRERGGRGASQELLGSAETSAAGGIGAQGLHGIENRRSWALTGLAIRAAYGLGRE